jgi:hypothetical protein
VRLFSFLFGFLKADLVRANSQTLAGGIDDDAAAMARKKKRASSKNSTPKPGDEEEDSDSPFSGAPLSKKPKKAAAAEKKDTTLHSIKWRRVVLDEGHLIKNPKAKMSRACADLKVERRWILTGTPIINAAGDRTSSLPLSLSSTRTDDVETNSRRHDSIPSNVQAARQSGCLASMGRKGRRCSC